MKKQLSIVLFILLPLINYSQESKDIDSTAVFILDRMSDIIGDLEAVSFDFETSADKLNDQGSIETHFTNGTLTMLGPDKLTARIHGDGGNKGIWYDGNYMSYYNFDEANYVTLEAPDNTIAMIDTMHVAYDFKFPAADFFYPSFTDDVLQDFDSVKYIGKRTINGEECVLIMATNSKMHVQLWVSSEVQMLPKRMLIIYKNEGNNRYEINFSNWKLNPNIPETIFDFLPPPESRLISILSKS